MKRPNKLIGSWRQIITTSVLFIALNSIVIFQIVTADQMNENVEKTSQFANQKAESNLPSLEKVSSSSQKALELSPIIDGAKLEPKKSEESSLKESKLDVKEPVLAAAAAPDSLVKEDSSSSKQQQQQQRKARAESGSNDSNKPAEASKTSETNDKISSANDKSSSNDKKSSESSSSASKSSSSSSKPSKSTSSSLNKNGTKRHQANIGSGGGVYKAKNDPYSSIAEKHTNSHHTTRSEKRRASHSSNFVGIQKASGIGDMFNPLKGVTDGGLARSKYNSIIMIRHINI